MSNVAVLRPRPAQPSPCSPRGVLAQWLVAFVLMLSMVAAVAAQNRVFYAGNAGREVFRDVHRLSDGSLLVAGQASNLDWIPAGVPRTVLPSTGLQSASAGNVGFILHTDGDFSAIRHVVHWPAGTARDVFKIRSTEVPGSRTGAIVISGSRDSGTTDGYYLARLVGNGVDAPISGVAWVYNVGASGGHKDRQPWDVGGDGGVVFATGREFDTNWAAIEKLNAQGQRTTVEHWHAHWHAGGEWDGTPASSYGNAAQPLQYSAVVMKVNRRGSLRSTTTADFALLQADGNGNTGRKGRFPDDYYHTAHCELSGTNTCANTGPGYTGYRAASAQTQRVGAIAVDRRDNAIYFGYSTKSVLPGGNPDFEPAIVAMEANGRLRWWDRGYRETAQNSSPDQYIDGLAIDHARNRLVVLGRTHGNNVINFWRGSEVTASTGAAGFQNQFTGTNGNIHISWLGSYALTTGRVQASTYVAEFVEGSTNYGAAHPDPLLGGWPNPNAGWPDVNTTRCGADAGFHGEIAIGPQGEIGLLCTGRRTLTTTDAHQRMGLPNVTPRDTGTWNDFVRVYSADLASVRYSSMLTGAWNRSTGAGGDNTDLVGIDLAADGVRVVGRHTANATNVANGVAVPTSNAPAWGAASPQGESALVAKLSGTRIGSSGAVTANGPQWLATLPPVAALSDRGFRDLALSNVPSSDDLRIDAYGPVAPSTSTGFATADPTPDDPFDANSGVGTFYQSLNAQPQARPLRVLVEVEPQGGTAELFVGVDDDADGVIEASELRCRATSATLARCDVAFTQAAGQLGRWWAVTQSRSGRVDFRLDAYAVAVGAPNTTPALAATTPAVALAGAAQPVRLVWNDPTLLSGERRAGWLRVSNGSAELGWVPVRIDRSGAQPAVAQALPLDADYTLALAANGEAHERLYVDVPAGATELRVRANSLRAMTLHLARRPLLGAEAAIPAVATAPLRSAAVAQTTLTTGSGELVLANPQAGRWYVTPTNPTTSAGQITLRASVVAAAPRPRGGGYFNSGRSGHGLFVYPAGSEWAALWYTYLQDGTPTWYYLQATAPAANGVWRAPIYRSTWNGRANRLVSVGEATLVPNLAPSPGGFVFSYTLDGESGSEAFVDFGGNCPTIGGTRIDTAGHWFDPARAGSGYSVQLFNDYEFYAAFVYDNRGVARFLAAERGALGGAVSALDLQQLGGFCPLCVRNGNPSRTTVGRLQRTLTGNRLSRITVDGAFVNGVAGRWTADDAVVPLGGLQGCTP
jgi:hypothetical protein